MTRRAILTAVLLLAACGVRQDPAGQADAALRVMTFNIRYGTAPDGEHAWPLRRGVTWRAIRDFDPHVLGVQEALRSQLDHLAAEFPDYGELGVGRDDGAKSGEYSAILYDRGALTPLDHGTFWLSDTPEVPGSMTWGNRFARITTWVRFRRISDGATFYVFNTHFDHESQPSRERSAALILDRIRRRAAPADPVILMGDFNAGEDNPAFQSFLASDEPRLYDTFRAIHPDAPMTGTYHAFRGDRSGPKIDAILASPHFRTISAAIVLLQQDGIFPSDHFPVTARLSLTGRAPPP